MDEWLPFKDNLFLWFNSHEERCLFHEPLNVSHAEAPTSRKAQGDTHIIFNDLKVLIEVHNSKSHCRYKEKDSKAFWLQYAQICFSFSVLQYSCLSVYLRGIQVFPQTALPSISQPRELWEVYMQLWAIEAHCLYLERLQ